LPADAYRQTQLFVPQRQRAACPLFSRADGQVLTLIARNDATGDQVIRYVYGTTLADSLVARADLLRAVIYPDADDSVDLANGRDGIYDRVQYRYNRLGQRTELADQNGTVHAYDFDAAGRLVQDRVTTLGQGVDSAVRRVQRQYGLRGELRRVTSFDASPTGEGLMTSDVQFDYNAFGLLDEEVQSHAGQSPQTVRYTYADGTQGHVRRTGLVYPNGRLLRYEYQDPAADALNRPSSLADDLSGQPQDLARYQYLGRNQVVEIEYPQPDMLFTLAERPEPDPYDGLDRFGRIVDMRWYGREEGTPSVEPAVRPLLEEVRYGYDRAGNRTWREMPVAESMGVDLDELYGYDGLHRLTDFDRGQLNGTHDRIDAPSRKQHWHLDATGNWSRFIDYNPTASDGGNEPQPVAWLDGWSKRKRITVDRSLLDAALADFPLLVAFDDDVELAQAQSDGADLRFTAADGVTLLTHERIEFEVSDAKAGGRFWVRLPQLSPDAPVTLYLYYGKADAQTATNPPGTWSSDYRGVWHFHGSSYTSSTGAGPQLTPHGNPVPLNTPWGRGLQFMFGRHQYLSASNSPQTDLSGVSAMTVSAWLKVSTAGAVAIHAGQYALETANLPDAGGKAVRFSLYADPQNVVSAQSEIPAPADSQWHLVTGVYDGVDLRLYVDGIFQPSSTNPTSYSQPVRTVATDFTVAARSSGGVQTNYFGGPITELRLSSVARSAAWIKFEYHNQNDAGNLLTWSEEQEPLPPAPPACPLLDQTRQHNAVNEILRFDATVGPVWSSPRYDRAGNMTRLPQPSDPRQSYTAVYDAWNRLVRLTDTLTGAMIAEYGYDGLNRRTLANEYSGGQLSDTRHFYYSDTWQVLERRVGDRCERQSVWGFRHIDDLVTHDQNLQTTGTSTERCFAIQDANWNVVGIVDLIDDDVVKRCVYTAYGTPESLTSRYVGHSNGDAGSNDIGLFAGHCYDAKTDFLLCRTRYYSPASGAFASRDLIAYRSRDISLYRYVHSSPLVANDSLGLAWWVYDFILHYWMGGGRGVTLTGTGIFETWKSRVQSQLDQQAVDTKLAIEGIALDCNRTSTRLKGKRDFSVDTYSRSALSDGVLYVLGGSAIHLEYECYANYDCICCPGADAKQVKSVWYHCQFAWSLDDSFENPLDIGGPYYVDHTAEREACYAKCKSDIPDSNLPLYWLRAECYARCGQKYPVTELPLATPYKITEHWNTAETWKRDIACN
jgi:RHS repeat-associated protein